MSEGTDGLGGPEGLDASEAFGPAGSEAGSTVAESASGTASGAAPRRGLMKWAVVGAAAIVAIAVTAVLVLTGGGESDAAASGGTPTPPFNPQALYPLAASATPFTTGGVSTLTDARLKAAVPGCGGCELVTRANGFSPDGAVLALFRTGAPAAGHPNAKLAVVGPDGRLLWQSPSGFQALTAGVERFATDRSGYFYVALPGFKSGQAMVVLAWQNGKVVDVGDLTHPKIASDSVGLLPEKKPGPTATIVAQTKKGVPDADTGGLIESQYQVRNGTPVLIGCRREVGESFQWLTFAPSADGCTHWPQGPTGPADGDDDTPGS